MRTILLISNMYPSSKEPGFGTFIKNIYTQLSEKGFTIDKLVIDKKNKKIKKILDYLALYVKSIFKYKNYDFIYIHFVSHTSIPFIILDALGFKFNLIAHVHGGDVKLLNGFNKFHFFLKKKLVQKSLKIANAILIPSESYKDYLIDNYQIDREKLFIYPSGGVNIELFNKKNQIKREKKLIGYAGRLIKSKNVDLIIKSLVDLPEIKLEIVGDGPELKSLNELANKLSLSGRVSFHSSYSQEELAIWYNKINVLVYPSDSESLGLVPLEAISCGAKVLLSNIPAFSELQKNGINVSLLDLKSPNNIFLLRNKISMLINESDNISNIIFENNIGIINKKYSSKATLGILQNVFK